jgi:hypothetical protein
MARSQASDTVFKTLLGNGTGSAFKHAQVIAILKALGFGPVCHGDHEVTHDSAGGHVSRDVRWNRGAATGGRVQGNFWLWSLSRTIYNPLGNLVWVARALSFADRHLVAGPSIPSYTAAAMKSGFTKRQGITILVIATVALIVLMILVFRATSVR